MSNPITSMFRSLQESENSRIGRMSERVAEHSIDSQKMVDELQRPQLLAHMYYLTEEQRPRAFNSWTTVNSYFAGRAGGVGSSFKSCRFYTDAARTKRDELMESMAEA